LPGRIDVSGFCEIIVESRGETWYAQRALSMTGFTVVSGMTWPAVSVGREKVK
jgi:hypothetical protein